MLKVFDSHVHVYPEAIAEKACVSLGHFYSFDVISKGTINDFLSQSVNAGTAGALIFSVATTAKQVEKINTFLSNTVTTAVEAGMKAVGFAAMHQDYTDIETEINRAEALGLKGVKIHPDIQEVNINDKRFFPLYELLEAKNMSMCFHMGDDRPQYRYSTADKLVDVMNNFPRLKVIAAHFGGYKAYEDSLKLLKGRDNIKFDTSSSLWVTGPVLAAKIIRELGAENIFYGTDYPIVILEEEIKKFLEVELTAKERDMILWDNAEEYFELNRI